MTGRSLLSFKNLFHKNSFLIQARALSPVVWAPHQQSQVPDRKLSGFCWMSVKGPILVLLLFAQAFKTVTVMSPRQAAFTSLGPTPTV